MSADQFTKGSVKWGMGIVAVIFTALLLAALTSPEKAASRIESRVDEHERRINAIEQFSAEQRADTRYIKESVDELKRMLRPSWPPAAKGN